MKTITTIITAILLSACASQAAIDGFYYKGATPYTVPAGKIVVLQQVSFLLTEITANRYIYLNGASLVAFPNATNGLYQLPKALFLAAGSIISMQSSSCAAFGVTIDTSDAPLFVGGGSSLGNVALVNSTLTGELQLPNIAGAKVLFQRSTDMVNWEYDNSVVVQHGSDKTKVRFTVLVAGAGNYYRAVVRRTNAA